MPVLIGTTIIGAILMVWIPYYMLKRRMKNIEQNDIDEKKKEDENK